MVAVTKREADGDVACRWENSESPLENEETSTRGALGSGAVREASGAFRLGVEGFGTVLHLGSNAGKERWADRASAETGGGSSSPDGPLITFP